MADIVQFSAQSRDQAGKGAARAARRAGRVPGIIYGKNMDPKMISVDPLELDQQIRKAGFSARVYEIDLGGEKLRVLARDVQLHPVTDRPIHVDFLRFGAETRLNTDVPVVFENQDASPGLRRGGVLNIVRHTVELICQADRIPPAITVDLSGLDIGDSVHISDVVLPDGAAPAITDRDFTIATIAAPTVVEEEVEEGEEGEEVPVEGEEAPDTEEPDGKTEA